MSATVQAIERRGGFPGAFIARAKKVFDRVMGPPHIKTPDLDTFIEKLRSEINPNITTTAFMYPESFPSSISPEITQYGLPNILRMVITSESKTSDGSIIAYDGNYGLINQNEAEDQAMRLKITAAALTATLQKGVPGAQIKLIAGGEEIPNDDRERLSQFHPAFLLASPGRLTHI